MGIYADAARVVRDPRAVKLSLTISEDRHWKDVLVNGLSLLAHLHGDGMQFTHIPHRFKKVTGYIHFEFMYGDNPVTITIRTLHTNHYSCGIMVTDVRGVICVIDFKNGYVVVPSENRIRKYDEIDYDQSVPSANNIKAAWEAANSVLEFLGERGDPLLYPND